MAATNYLLKGGGTLLSRCNRTFITTTTTTTASRVLSLPLSSISPLHSTPPTPASPNPKLIATRHVRRLCTAADASESVADSSTPPAAPPSSSSPAGNDKDAVNEAAKLLDIRVGKVLKAWRHPDADSLYVEEVDIGEAEPRTICSGLVKYVPIDDLQDKKVVVLANLKPRNMRGIKSCGMLMAASDASHENVELLVPPEDSVPGERIWFGLEDEKGNQPDAASPNQIQKKKVWESVQPHLKTDATCVAMLDGHHMRTSAGTVVSRSLKNANIS